MSDDEISLDSEEKGPTASYSLYYAEGEVLFKAGQYDKALEYFNISLLLEPRDQKSLVARSKCYLQLSLVESALADAESALLENPDYVKALYQKAEALYYMGEFEYALVYYHRAERRHFAGEHYRLGVQKAKEAIRNAIGDAKIIKLEKKGDLSYFTKQAESLIVQKGSRVTQPIQRPFQQLVKPLQKKAQSEKTVKQLLGELYADKIYLEKLLHNSYAIKPNILGRKEIFKSVQDSLKFLEKRQEFWRQQNPVYARKKFQHLTRENLAVKRFSTKPIFEAMNEIQLALKEHRYKDCISIAKGILFSVKKRFDIKERTDMLCDLYNAMGNAYFERKEYVEAVEAYKNTLDIAKLHNSIDWTSLAINNIGRAYALGGQFSKAIDIFKKKIHSCSSVLESTWLYHEIGRCYFELGNFKQAMEFSQRSLSAAEIIEDIVWKLHANVLIAQTKAHMGDKIASMDKFHLALELARQVGDTQMEAAIHRALFENRYSEKMSKVETSPASASDVESFADTLVASDG